MNLVLHDAIVMLCLVAFLVTFTTLLVLASDAARERAVMNPSAQHFQLDTSSGVCFTPSDTHRINDPREVGMNESKIARLIAKVEASIRPITPEEDQANAIAWLKAEQYGDDRIRIARSIAGDEFVDSWLARQQP
jgi:hypothetical protein